MPMARSIPSARMARTASAIHGGECFIPTYARNRPGSRSSRAATIPLA